MGRKYPTKSLPRQLRVSASPTNPILQNSHRNPVVLKPQFRQSPFLRHWLLLPLQAQGSHTLPIVFGGHTHQPVTGSHILLGPLQPQAAGKEERKKLLP